MAIPFALVALFLFMYLLPYSAATPISDAVASARINSLSRPAPKSSIYESRYQRIWQLVADNFLYRERLNDWDQWRHKFDGRLNNENATKKAISQMLDSLGDDYTYFRDEKSTKVKAHEDEESGAVAAKMLSGGIGYLKIKTFETNNVAKETRDALQTLVNAKEYLIDLRHNKGGYMEEAYSVFAMLSKEDSFGSFRGWDNGRNYYEDLRLTDDYVRRTLNGSTKQMPRERNLTGNKPIVILVNEDTRSAAEMLAGALRDNGRARLVGTKTFGKGIVQDVWDLADGTSVKVTCARFYLPSGSPIHGVGVYPDLEVKPSIMGDTQLYVAMALLERMAPTVASSPHGVTGSITLRALPAS
jgi:C-terminal processing protease CtpA/Prc